MFVQNQKVVKTLVVSFVVSVLAGCNIDPVWKTNQVRGPDMNKPSPRPSQPIGGRDIAVAQPSEVDLVEDAVAKRQAYHTALSDLQHYYADHGYATKESWARSELESAMGIRQFRYLLDAEIPSAALTASDSIAEADAMYEKGLEIMKKAGHGIPGIFSRREMLRAADVFRKLIKQYPSSDKIDDAAFQLGTIHEEYLPNQEILAAKWYERAWTWDPHTPHPARFQAASVYDFRLHDRDHALELYQQVVSEEPELVPGNTRFATRRIRQLSTDRKRRTVRVESSQE